LIGLALELPPLRLEFAERPDKRPSTCRRMNHLSENLGLKSRTSMRFFDDVLVACDGYAIRCLAFDTTLVAAQLPKNQSECQKAMTFFGIDRAAIYALAASHFLKADFSNRKQTGQCNAELDER
jgi:hypothetical protein